MNASQLYPFVRILWCVFYSYWLVLSLDRKALKSRESWSERLRYMAPVVLGSWLLMSDQSKHGWLGVRLLPDSHAVGALGALFTAVGFFFAVWARRKLGKNWSGIVSIREAHELIRSGPYRFIRHPIYSGLLLAVAGTGLLLGEARALLAALLIFAAFYCKASKEEKWLGREFGEEFQRHISQTGMFFPRLRLILNSSIL